MRNRHRRTAATAGALVVAGLAGLAGVAVAGTWSASPAQDVAAGGSVATAVAAPPPFSVPTPAAPEPLDVEPAPDAPVARDEPVPADGGTVQVIVTFAGVEPSVDGVEVDGFVSGVVEGSGVCTLRLTRGERSAEVSREAVPDATTTSCGALVVPLDDLAAGTWEAVLSYSSPTSTGTADPVRVEIG